MSFDAWLLRYAYLNLPRDVFAFGDVCLVPCYMNVRFEGWYAIFGCFRCML